MSMQMYQGKTSRIRCQLSSDSILTTAGMQSQEMKMYTVAITSNKPGCKIDYEGTGRTFFARFYLEPPEECCCTVFVFCTS